MSTDPYHRGSFQENPFFAKTNLEGALVVVLHAYLSSRELKLIKPISRVLRQGEIHELIATDETEAAPGMSVNRIAYLGFMEISRGGVAVAGDTCIINGEAIGTLAGFDESHAPNHYNIVIKVPSLVSGKDRALKVGDAVQLSGPSR